MLTDIEDKDATLIDRLIRERDEARARVKVLEDALLPFAQYAENGAFAEPSHHRARKALERSLSPLPHNQEL